MLKVKDTRYFVNFGLQIREVSLVLKYFFPNFAQLWLTDWLFDNMSTWLYNHILCYVSMCWFTWDGNFGYYLGLFLSKQCCNNFLESYRIVLTMFIILMQILNIWCWCVNVSCHNVNVMRYLLCIKVCNGEDFIRVNSVQECTNFRSLYGLNFSL